MQMDNLEKVLNNVIATLEQGRGEIFDISQDCHEQVTALEVEHREINLEIRDVINQVTEMERQERRARVRLMEVSRDFNRYNQESIREAYEAARELQIILIDLRQKEQYLHRRRKEMGIQIKKFDNIAQKADHFLQSTGMALKILQGNVERINDSLEDIQRKQQMEMWIIESQEAERRRIARDLHDGPAQSLASMLIRLDLIGHLWGDDSQNILEEIDNIRQMGKETLSDIRRLMFDLKPSLMHEDNFATTLRDFFHDYEAKYNFNIEFVLFGKERKYDMSLEIALFRLVQESLTNVRKHSGMKSALVKLEDRGEELTLIIKDEGGGFELEQVRDNKESYGILGMMERVKLFGGQMEILSSRGLGTQVIIKVPLEGGASSEQN